MSDTGEVGSVRQVCVLGPSGRMGALVIDEILSCEGARLAAAIDHPNSRLIGTEAAPGIIVGSDVRAGLAAADVYIDFTTPDATRAAAEVARDLGTVAAVVGTTGLDESASAALARLEERAPVLVAANFSLGVNALFGLAERAARALGHSFDIEVVEIHHKHKRDAPSGTALALAEALARGRDGRSHNRLTRAGDIGPRSPDEIGVMAVRGGDVAGEHTAYFLGPNERLELTHRAGSRTIFAQGAVRAATWLAGRPAGRYHMRDVLGL